jgi:hypothetical protein
VGSISINHRTDVATLKSFENCTVLEGFFQINSALLDYQKETYDTHTTDHIDNFFLASFRSMRDFFPRKEDLMIFAIKFS